MFTMKTIRYFLLLLALVPVLSGLAQDDDLQDVIYVHSGSIYRGRIQSPPGAATYQIEIYGGSMISVPGAEVDSVRREAAIVVRDRYTSRWISAKSSSYTRIEACGSLLMYAQQPQIPGAQAQYVYGAGLSFMPEFCKPHRNFSLLVGLAAQVMNAHNFSYSRIDYYASGTMDNGVHTRFEIPLWFRWSWGHRIGMFFQFGVSTGFNCYMGRGHEYSHGGLGPGGGSYDRYGRFKFYDGFINISPMAFGIRKELPSHLSLIAYLEGAPANIEFAGNVYMPYVQVHLGINFDPKYFIKKRKEQHSSKILQKNVL